jgi:FkbM family methyltransferase
MIKEISDGNISYKILLPNHETDHLQKLIKNLSKPYELEMLKDMSRKIDSNKVVLDIGSNIGNHAIYLALSTGCKVICFEPDKNMCESILYTANLNNVKNIEIQNVAIGNENTKCRIIPSKENPESVGSQQVSLDFGDIQMTTIDDYKFEQVDCLKIDVEGFEEKVLLGAKETIVKNNPIMYIEAWNEEALNKIIDIVEPLGYNKKQKFNATPTYLFTKD